MSQDRAHYHQTGKKRLRLIRTMKEAPLTPPSFAP